MVAKDFTVDRSSAEGLRFRDLQEREVGWAEGCALNEPRERIWRHRCRVRKEPEQQEREEGRGGSKDRNQAGSNTHTSEHQP